MIFSYDSRYNIAYIRFQPKTSEIESIKVSDELTVDLAPDGTVYGIELLNANEQLRRGGMGKFLVVNDATGQQVDIPLPSSFHPEMKMDTRAVSRSEMSNFLQDQESQGLVRLWRGCAETYIQYVAQATPAG
jgi:uncharacterized protein YuzE